MIFDSHAHYDSEQFDEDRDEILSSYLPENGVVGLINMAASFESLEETLGLTRKYPFVYGALGIHPGCADEIPENYLDVIESGLKDSKIVCVGEIGLDYYWENNPSKERQKEVFENQIKLAIKHDLPIAVHDRNAHGDTLEILQKYKPKGVVHCFSGSREMAREIVKLGMYIGMGGVITFGNSRQSVKVIEALPLDRLLLETDCPYLAPVPMRGKRNNSAYISYIADKIGDIRGMSGEEILKISRDNVKTLFGI